MLYLELNFEEFIQDTNNKFLTSSEFYLENIIVGLFKCIDKMDIKAKVRRKEEEGIKHLIIDSNVLKSL
jgi:hypothetical protein